MRARPGLVGTRPLAALQATRAHRCAPPIGGLNAPVEPSQGARMVLDAQEAIKPVEVATGLNPAYFNANWQNFAESRQSPQSCYLQGVSAKSQAVQYRFTRERPVVRAHPCP